MKTSRDPAEQIHRDDLARAVKSTPKANEGGRMNKIRSVLTDGAKRVEGMLLDSFTASMLCQIHDSLSPENQAKFVNYPLRSMVDIGWKIVKKQEKGS